ncbi:MAG: flagellar motor stator protein MotA [Neomegalonema sp.]|nr:flagellar motor stator protein MotA [Neomegalonema sp.]
MGAIVGIIIIFVMVFGGYTLAGGKMGIIIKALPFEMMMIGGSAVGAFVLSHDGGTIKHVMHDFGKIFKGGKWHKHDYVDILSLMFQLIRIGQTAPLELEQHIENPSESALFGMYPKIQGDKRACDMICDTFRNSSMNFDDPHQVEDLLEKQLDADKETAGHTSHAIQATADALPALGIVAAVLGVIKTMAAIDQPPPVLGGMIGGALVGTFLGVFLAYGFVGPFATRLQGVADHDHVFYTLIRDVLIANLHRHPPNICVEVGRQNVPRDYRPSFAEVEEKLRELKAKAA